MENLTTAILAALSSSVLASGVAVWLSKIYISEKLKSDHAKLLEGVKNQYAENIEKLRNQLSADLLFKSHDLESNRQRANLFFDHQRNAFVEVMASVSQLHRTWWTDGFDDNSGMLAYAPLELVKDLRKTMVQHQLFLLPDALMALDLLNEAYRRSYKKGTVDGYEHFPDAFASYAVARYVESRLALLFQNQIGVNSDRTGLQQIAKLCGIFKVNQLRFLEFKLPPGSPLRHARFDTPDQAVAKADANFSDLVIQLAAMRRTIKKESGFHEEEAQIARILAVLTASETRPGG